MDAYTYCAIFDAQAAQQRKILKAVMEQENACSLPWMSFQLLLLPRLPNSSQIRYRYAFLSSHTIRATVSTYGTITTRTSSKKTAPLLTTPSELASSSQSWMPPRTLASRATSYRRRRDVPLDEIVKTLRELFGHNTSVFTRRYAYLWTQRNDESICDYIGLVNRRHEMAEFNGVTLEQQQQ
ncbi:hypothetical protein Aduo_008379 [Ancylostoma duodenale]